MSKIYVQFYWKKLQNNYKIRFHNYNFKKKTYIRFSFMITEI